MADTLYVTSNNHDVSNLFTSLLEGIEKNADELGVQVLFDYAGPSFEATEDQASFIESWLPMLKDCVERARRGYLFFAVEVLPHRDRSATMLVQIIGSRVSEQSKDLLIGALDPRKAATQIQAPPYFAPAMRRAVEAQQGTFSLGELPHAGRVIQMDFHWPAQGFSADITAAQSHGHGVWLIDPDSLASEALARRLQRLGWKPELLSSIEQARDRLDQAGTRPPLLAMVAPRECADSATFEALRHRLPGNSTLVALKHQACGDASTALHKESETDQLFWPLSPWALYKTSQAALRKANTKLDGARQPPHHLPSRPRALVVEDNMINQLLSTELLKLFGFEVDVANHGGEAVAYLNENSPALILMDIDMPVMDGFEATTRIRQMQLTRNLPPVPIIAATAGDRESYAQRAIDAGMDGFIEKPINVEVMRKEIRRVMSDRARMN